MRLLRKILSVTLAAALVTATVSIAPANYDNAVYADTDPIVLDESDATEVQAAVVPTIAKVSVAKKVYAVDERVTFNITANGAVTHLWIYCPDGSTLTYKKVGTSYSVGFGMSGHFEALVQTWNGSDNKMSSRISWYVGLPQKAKMTISKTDYNVGENVSFNFDTEGTTNSLIVYNPDGTTRVIDNVVSPYRMSFTEGGTYQAIVRTTNINGSKDSPMVTFTVHDKGISSASIPKSTYVYTGSPIYPELTVYDIDGNKLSSDYYTVETVNNTKVGTATITVKGDGEYNGTVTKTFTINPAKPAIKSMTPGRSKLTVKMTTKPAAKGAGSYQIAYKQKGTSKWKYLTTTYQSKSISKLKKGKRYYVKVRAIKKVGTKTYYGAWTAVKLSAKIK